MKRVAVLQSNYIPWKGYFDIIHDVDEFIFYDEVQYTKNDWRNRNQVMTDNGLKWLTIPCGYDLNRKIVDVKIKNDICWQKDHYNAIRQNYVQAPYFKMFEDFFNYVYVEHNWEHLCELNRYLITTIAKEFLGISVQFSDSRDYYSEGSRQEKLISLLKSAEATCYISGSAAQNYIIEDDFTADGINIIWKDYNGYPPYTQNLHQPFCHNVSIVDLLINEGPNASDYIWGWRKK